MSASRPLLAAVMIVKNEEQHLARCLSSIRTVCDEIIIVDTGSTDKTISIAESFNAKVFHRVWNDDFAAARNESLSHTDAQWVLYIDADEILTNVDSFPLRTLIAESRDVAAFGLQISPLVGWMPYTDFRLWRHDPQIQFVGDIHETTLPDIQRLAGERGQVLQSIPLHMQHLGYESDQTKKNLRNLPLLERQLEVTPRKINIIGQLGRIHLALGNHDKAEEVLLHAVNIVREDGEKEVTDVVALISLAQLYFARGEDVHELLVEAQTFRPDYLVTHLIFAQNHFAQGRYQEAREHARYLCDRTQAERRDSRYAYNMMMFTIWPQQIIAECHLALGEYEQARLSFGDLATIGFPYEHVREKIRLCEKHMWATHRESLPDTSFTPDLSDVTFLIPLRIDSGERLRNVMTTTSWLVDHLNTNVIVGIADVLSVESLLDSRVRVVQIDDHPHLPFHSTRVFNELSQYVTTPIFVHYDTDIIIPVEQFHPAAEMIRSNEYDVVLPFDTWVSVPSDEIPTLLEQNNVAYAPVGYPRSLGDPVGGCVMRSMHNFIDVGMDNEHFIGWSPEDKERIYRAQTLGSRVTRIPGPMFHLEHPRQTLQPYRDPYWQAGHAEFERIQTLTPAELREEISDWPWRNDHTLRTDRFFDASDLTITIPVRIDSPDRLRNLITCTNILAKQTNARVLVGIGDPATVQHLLDPRIEVLEVADAPNTVFHRARILNDLARHASTEFVANLDCDVVVPLKQWIESLDYLRSRKSELVYPYDGMMLDLPYGYHPWLEHADYLSLPTTLQQVMHETSLGGCVIWRRDEFFAAGMENEHLISWGFDDDERYARARSLGLRVHRVNGCVYHFSHHRGVNSSPANPQLINNRNEFLRISEMQSDQLHREIARWSWKSQVADRKTQILIWDDLWHSMTYFSDDHDSTYVVSRSRDDLEKADVIVVSLPLTLIDDLVALRQRLLPTQKIIGFCREAVSRTAIFRDSRITEVCDAFMTYELSSDFPSPYLPQDGFDNLPRIQPLVNRRKTLISAWASSPDEMSGRTQLLEELMSHISIDSYGHILRNTSLDNDMGEKTKIETIASYRFTLALENAICEDYVTEKFFQPLLVGSVPIYLGAPNIKDFAPGNKCFINVNDFSCPSDFADYLRSMSDEEYLSFHKWREEPIREGFRNLCTKSDRSPFTQLAAWHQQLSLADGDPLETFAHQ